MFILNGEQCLVFVLPYIAPSGSKNRNHWHLYNWDYL